MCNNGGAEATKHVDEMMKTLTGDHEIVGSVVRQHVAAFTSYGFELDNTSVKWFSTLGPSLVFHFVNSSTGMQMHIAFFVVRAGQSGGFVVLIENSTKLKLNVEDFLKLHGENESTRFFSYRDPGTDLVRYADSFFQKLVELFETSLKPIIEGKTFEETPIDWMGYK